MSSENILFLMKNVDMHFKKRAYGSHTAMLLMYDLCKSE